MKRKLDGAMNNNSDEDENDESWVIVDETKKELVGMSIQIDKKTGHVTSLSTRRCKDANRWITMPSVEHHSALRELDLHKSRYLRELDVSICTLVNLKTLILTNCERLTTLPTFIGQCVNLQEVSFRRGTLPEPTNKSINNKKNSFLSCISDRSN
jgi:hypothetical protein